MLMQTSLAHTSTAERSRLLSANEIRRRALERLYERRQTVSELIHSLEEYQRIKEFRQIRIVKFSAVR